MNRILVLDHRTPESHRVIGLLEAHGYLPVPVMDLAALPVEATTAGAVICDRTQAPLVLATPVRPLVVLDREPDLRAAVTIIKAGASDYLPADCTGPELAEALARAIDECRNHRDVAFAMIGASSAMQSLAQSIAKAAPTDSTVLITGESGTGKELVARALHSSSARRAAPLLSLNCATVPSDQIEAELFGRLTDQQGGLIHAASGGTLFLDEVGELPPAAQSRLLRTLDAMLDIRLIAASHRDLQSLVSSGQFRKDLYYRLKVIALYVPPLKDRGDDVLLLANEILDRTMQKLGKKDLYFTDATLEDMRRYAWPGNVRELENAIQRAVILSDGGAIETSMLAIEPPRAGATGTERTAAPEQTIEDYFVSFVTAHQDNMTETELAAKLGISRKSLWERRQRLNIPRKKTRKRGRRRDVS
ncbi:MAG TPA: sigma-54 dependent transcriptional regulator [Pseudomonadales bacterium]